MFKFENFMIIKVFDCKKLMTFYMRLYRFKFYQSISSLCQPIHKHWTSGLCIIKMNKTRCCVITQTTNRTQHLCLFVLSQLFVENTSEQRNTRVFISNKKIMTMKWMITLIACWLICLFTPIWFHIFTIPFIVWCIWWKKMRKFYFNFIFGSWK